MFCWTDDMISYMRAAAEHGSYQKELANWICSEIAEKKHVCDAGCGLGFLSLQLAGQFERVTAADISSQVLAVLREGAAERRTENLTILQTDMTRYVPQVPFDAMVFCLYGRMREILGIARRCCRGRIVIVKKAYTHHRFSVSSVPLKDETTDQAAQVLQLFGVPFTLETRTFEMGQPLRSIDDAMHFFEIYSKDVPGTLTREAVAGRLVQTGEAQFPFYLPQSKALGRFTIETADIPEEIQ